MTATDMNFNTPHSLERLHSLKVDNGITPFIWAQSFKILKLPEEWPFVWLKSVDQEPLCFLCVPLELLFPQQTQELLAHLIPWINQTGDPQYILLGIVVLRRDPQDITVNMLAPLLVDLYHGTGRQVIVDGPIELTRQRIAPALATLSANS